MSLKRNRMQIIRDILTAIHDKEDKARPTHILYKSNLSSQMLSEYFKELMSKEFILERIDAKGSKFYSLTQKGYDYLKDYKLVQSFVDSYGLD